MHNNLSPHQQRKRDAMIARILDTARAIMRAEGVAALSMQELARQLNLRAPSLYNYFSSKMDLYDALYRLGFTLFAEHMAQSIQNTQSWQEEIQLTIEAYMGFALQNPELYQLCFERPVPGFTPSAESLQVSTNMLQQYYARMEKFIPSLATDLQEEQITDLVIAIMHGLTALHIANHPHLPVGEGRFGALVPAVLSLLDTAWRK